MFRRQQQDAAGPAEGPSTSGVFSREQVSEAAWARERYTACTKDPHKMYQGIPRRSQPVLGVGLTHAWPWMQPAPCAPTRPAATQAVNTAARVELSQYYPLAGGQPSNTDVITFSSLGPAGASPFRRGAASPAGMDLPPPRIVVEQPDGSLFVAVDEERVPKQAPRLERAASNADSLPADSEARAAALEGGRARLVGPACCPAIQPITGCVDAAPEGGGGDGGRCSAGAESLSLDASHTRHAVGPLPPWVPHPLPRPRRAAPARPGVPEACAAAQEDRIHGAAA